MYIHEKTLILAKKQKKKLFFGKCKLRLRGGGTMIFPIARTRKFESHRDRKPNFLQRKYFTYKVRQLVYLKQLCLVY